MASNSTDKASADKKKSDTKDFSLSNPNDPKPVSSNDNKTALFGLDDDDEFEEFPLDRTHIDQNEEDEKDTIWEDNWQDETVGEDFSTELRAELEKLGHKPMI